MGTAFTRLGFALFFVVMPAGSPDWKSANASNQPTAAKLEIQAKIARGGDYIAYAFDSAWMVSGNRLIRVNSADNGLNEIKIEGLIGPNRGIADGENAIWVPDTGSKMIFKVDPLKGQVTLRIPAALADSEGSIGVGEGAVWVVTTAGEGVKSREYNRTLSRFNAHSGALESTVHLPSRGAGVIVADGSVWITGVDKGELYRLDPQTNQIVATIGLHKRPRFMAASDGAVWVLNQSDGTVQRIDTKRNVVAATIEAVAPGDGIDIAFGNGLVWVATLEPLFIKIDATTNSVIGSYKVPSEEYVIGHAIRYGAGSLWVSGGNIFRIKFP